MNRSVQLFMAVILGLGISFIPFSPTSSLAEEKPDQKPANDKADDEKSRREEPEEAPEEAEVKIEVFQNGVPGGQIQVQVQVQREAPGRLQKAKPIQVQINGNARQIQVQGVQKAEAKPEKEEAAPAKKPQRAVQNPLQKLIRKILPIPGQAQPETPKDENEDGESSGRDQIDSLAPQDPKQAAMLRKVHKWIELKQWKLALDGLQQILEKPGDSLYRTPEGRWISMRVEALRIIGTLPPEALELYRNQYDELARQLLEDSLKTGNVTGIMEVATKFLFTSSGDDAANWIGSYHLQRGEYVLAGLWFERIVNIQSPLIKDPAWLVKSALAWRLSGQDQLVETARASIATLTDPKVTLGGEAFEPVDWMAKTTGEIKRDDGSPLPREEWTQFLGTSHRIAGMIGEDPLLLSRWEQHTTDDRRILDQIQLMYDDLLDEGMSVLPVWFPLAVKGKLIFRTLDGIRVVDADTGKMEWETDSRNSPVRMLNGYNDIDPFGVQAGNVQRVFRGRVNIRAGGGPFNFMIAQNQYFGNGANHPLMNLLLHDAAYGTISSDGDRLFVLEDHAVLSHRHPGAMWGGDPNDDDPFRRDWTSNRLTSYSLRTGRSLWEVGGEHRDEPFDLPLSGECFLGPPLVDGGELVIAGEQDSELKIFGLDPRTGEERWSQLVSFINTKIEQDLVRRWWPLHISSSQGVLVCPTGVGWLLGIDRRQQSLLWAHRYSTPQSNPNRNGQQFVITEFRPLNARWMPSAPMIVGHRVLFTPPEEPTLVCLNLRDGTPLWQQPKGNWLYLAGVAHGRAILVGTNAVAGLSIETGKEEWKVSFSDADGHPCGMGVLAGDNYYVPLHTGQLWTIDLQKGERKSVTYLPDGNPLGNLMLYRNQLISQGLFGIQSFELRGPILADLDRRRRENPEDPWAHLRVAEIAALGHHLDETLEHLHRVDPDKLNSEDRLRYDALLRETLQELVRGDLKGRDAEFDELRGLSHSAEERLLLTRLSLERLMARGELTQALDVLWELTTTPPEIEEIAISIPGNAGQRGTRVEQLRFDDWLSARFLELYRMRNNELNVELTRRLREYASAIEGEQVDDEVLHRYVKLFGFHNASLPIRRQLVERAMNSEDWVEAEQGLLQLANRSDREVRAWAWWKLAEMFRRIGFPREAIVCYQRLKREYADVVLDNGLTGAALFDQLTQEGQLPLLPRIAEISWNKAELQMTKSSTGYWSQPMLPLMLQGGVWPFFKQHRFQMNQQDERLNINSADEGVFWSIPLRSMGHYNNQAINAIADDHQVVLNYRNVIHRLSLLDRKVLWSWPMDERSTNNVYYHHQMQTAQPLVSTAQWINRNELNRQQHFNDPLAVANENYVCVTHRRGMTVLDGRTGKIRWKRTDLPARSRIFGNEDYLVVNVPQSSKIMILDARDGQEVDLPDLVKLIPKTIMVTERGFLIGERVSGSGGSRRGEIALELIDPSTQVSLWKQRFQADSFIGQNTATELQILRESGELQTLDLDTGELVELGSIPVDEDNKRNPEVYVVSDAYQTYVISNKRQGNAFQQENMPALRINGTITAFRSGEAKPAWSVERQNTYLCMESLNESPVLVFSSREYKQQGSYWESHLSVLDKGTGEPLVEGDIPSNSGFTTMQIDGPKRTIEMRSYNELLLIQPVESQAAKD